jgi:long-chain acyl-CoA synthetase
MKICFCVDILQVYGMTESCGATCITMASDNQQGIVGGPIMNTKIKIKDSGDFLAADSKGEICLSGNVAKAYLKGDALEEWISTGDLGEILPNGALRVIDRIENIYKLTQGEHIFPVKLENIYMQSEFVR